VVYRKFKKERLALLPAPVCFNNNWYKHN